MDFHLYLNPFSLVVSWFCGCFLFTPLRKAASCAVRKTRTQYELIDCCILIFQILIVTLIVSITFDTQQVEVLGILFLNWLYQAYVWWQCAVWLCAAEIRARKARLIVFMLLMPLAFNLSFTGVYLLWIARFEFRSTSDLEHIISSCLVIGFAFSTYYTTRFGLEWVLSHAGMDDRKDLAPSGLVEARALARKLASEAYKAHRPLDWFERLYREADRNPQYIPWANLNAHPLLRDWLEQYGAQYLKPQDRALVIGCGLGDDAEALEPYIAQIVAFDLSPSAIAWAQQRFPESKVQYETANVLEPPTSWRDRFDFVLECYTLQALPELLRAEALKTIPAQLKPGGYLLLIARLRDEGEALGELPWPLARSELEVLKMRGMVELVFERLDRDGPHLRSLWQRTN